MPSQKLTMEELVEKWMNHNNIFCFEGSSGLARFEKLLSVLGVRKHNLKHGSLIEVFLSNNSGAVDALVEWIGKQSDSDWEAALEEIVGAENEEEEENNDEND